MELNDEPEETAPPAETKRQPRRAEPVADQKLEAEEEAKVAAQENDLGPEAEEEAVAEAELEAEVAADVASYRSEIEDEIAADKVKVEKEEVAGEYSYEPPSHPITKRESLFKRLAPYLTVAGLLLIARIVVYSLRRRRR